MNKLNFEQLDLEPLKFSNFREYLSFVMKAKRPLSFVDFQKHCGISRKQWDLFKFNNRELEEIDWVME